MPDRYSLAFLFGLLTLFLQYNLPIPEYSYIPPLTGQTIGEKVPLSLAIAATILRKGCPDSALLPLTPISARSRIHSTLKPTTKPIQLHLPHPDPSTTTKLSVARTLLTSPATLRLLASPSLAAVFCPVPGTGSISLTKHLSKTGPLIPLSSLALRDRERLLVRPDVFRFLFVAHPFTRTLTAFYRGIVTSDRLDSTEYRDFMARVRGRKLAETEHEIQLLSFQFFLTFLSRQTPWELHQDFRSQTALCGVGNVSFTFVGKMENFATDVQFVNSKLGLGGAVVQADPFFLQAEHNTTAAFRNPRIRNKASKLYRDDLSNFGYS